MVWTYLHVCKPADWACRKNWHTDRMKRFVLILRRSCGRFFVYVWALMTFELCLKCQIFALIRRPYLLTVLTTQYCEAYFNKHTHTHLSPFAFFSHANFSSIYRHIFSFLFVERFFFARNCFFVLWHLDVFRYFTIKFWAWVTSTVVSGYNLRPAIKITKGKKLNVNIQFD